MNVVAFAASNSRASINKQLVTYATGNLNGNVEILDLNDYEMPIYSFDREQESGHPEEAKQFLSKIEGADAVVISFAEHNGSYTAAYKNIYDWVSRLKQKVFEGKQVVLLAASPGPNGAKNVLAGAVGAFPFFGAQVVGSLSIARFFDVFDAEAGKLTDTELDAKLSDLMAQL